MNFLIVYQFVLLLLLKMELHVEHENFNDECIFRWIFMDFLLISLLQLGHDIFVFCLLHIAFILKPAR